jgi:transposase
MNVYVGMDVHRKRSQVAIVDAAGVAQRYRNLANDPAKLARSLAPLRRVPRWPSRPPTVGAGWSICWRSWSWSRTWSIPAPARQSPPPGCRNDKVDAATLAQLLRADLLPEAGIAPQQVRDLRTLLRHRASLVRLSTLLKNRMHGVLADRGIGEDRGLWTGPGRAWLADLELPPIPRGIIQDCGGLLDALATPIGRLEREIAALAKPDPRVQALMVLPGVGKLTAMTLVAEIGDIGRFPTAANCAPGPGLTPQVRPSDRTLRHGHITRQGSPWVRGILGGGRPDGQAPPMFAGADGQLARRRGNHIATTAIARRRLARSFHEPATRPPGLTEQPGSGLTVMRTPPSGPDWAHGSHLRTAVRAFSHIPFRHQPPATGPRPGRSFRAP